MLSALLGIYWFLCQFLITNTFTATCELTLDQMSRYHGLAKLIHKLNMRGSKQHINNLVKPWLGVNIYPKVNHFSQFSSGSQSCLTVCNPMNCSKPGLLVHNQFLEFTQTHGNRVSDVSVRMRVISFSVVYFSSHLQSFPASGSFQMSQFFTSGSQSIGVSTSASVLPMNIQDWFPLGWTGWISL